MANYETYDQFGTRDTPHQIALKELEARIHRLEDRFNDSPESYPLSDVDIRMACLATAGGDIAKAGDMFSFVKGESK